MSLTFCAATLFTCSLFAFLSEFDVIIKEDLERYFMQLKFANLVFHSFFFFNKLHESVEVVWDLDILIVFFNMKSE